MKILPIANLRSPIGTIARDEEFADLEFREVKDSNA